MVGYAGTGTGSPACIVHADDLELIQCQGHGAVTVSPFRGLFLMLLSF